MAVVIVAPDMKRLIGFFFLNRDIPPPEQYPVMDKEWKWPRIIFKSVAIVLIMTPFFLLFSGQQQPRSSPGQLINGIYNVQQFERNNEAVPPLTTDTTRWKQLLIDKSGRGGIVLMSDKPVYCEMKMDTVARSITLNYRDDTGRLTMNYSIQDSSKLVLSGKIKGDSVRISFSRESVDSLPLVSRGFHWINEYPYNR
jgi:hypothetical protein